MVLWGGLVCYEKGPLSALLPHPDNTIHHGLPHRSFYEETNWWNFDEPHRYMPSADATSKTQIEKFHLWITITPLHTPPHHTSPYNQMGPYLHLYYQLTLRNGPTHTHGTFNIVPIISTFLAIFFYQIKSLRC